jgi:predicted nucleic acid-binding Zn ribbon protein
MKTCLECGDKIIGREDKKFCSDACRNAYNNKMNKDTNNLMRNINNRLRKNYRILQEINPDGKIKTSKSKLLSKGFSFDWFTNIVQTKTGNTYFFIYDQGYMLLEQEFVIVVKKDM